MNKRIAFKTALICTGIFIIILSIGVFVLSNRYELDTEKKYNVLVATTDINPGDILNESMVTTRIIKESAYNRHMILDAKAAAGKKTLSKIAVGDYIQSYNLLPKEQWHTDDQKIIILPMDIEERLANIIKKGSLVDIRILFNDIRSIPQTVLSRVKIEDVLDENGVSLGSTNNSKKAYAVVILDEKQRDRIYAAQQLGTLIFEAYCDTTQRVTREIFQIPDEFYKVQPVIDGGSNSIPVPDTEDNGKTNQESAQQKGGQ